MDPTTRYAGWIPAAKPRSCFDGHEIIACFADVCIVNLASNTCLMTKITWPVVAFKLSSRIFTNYVAAFRWMMCCEKNTDWSDCFCCFPLSIPIFSFFQSVLVGSIYVRFSMFFTPLTHPSNTTTAWVVQEEFEEAIKSMEEVLEVLQIKRFAKRYRHQKAFCSMQMNILAWLFCEIDKTESQNSRAPQNEIWFTWQWFQIKTLKRTPWHYNVTLVLINQHELVRWRTIHPGVCSRALSIEPNRLRKVIDGCWWRVVLETFLDGAGNPPFIYDFPSETAISWGRIPSLVDDSPQEDVGGRNWSSFSGGGCMV